MTFGRAIVDGSTDPTGAPIVWTVMPPLLWSDANGQNTVAKPADPARAQAVVPGRGIMWLNVVGQDPARPGEVFYED